MSDCCAENLYCFPSLLSVWDCWMVFACIFISCRQHRRLSDCQIICSCAFRGPSELVRSFSFGLYICVSKSSHNKGEVKSKQILADFPEIFERGPFIPRMIGVNRMDANISSLLLSTGLFSPGLHHAFWSDSETELLLGWPWRGISSSYWEPRRT